MKNAAQPDGDVVLWANEDGYVHGLRIIYDKPDASGGSSLFLIQSIIFNVLTGDDISNVRFYRQEYGQVNGFYVNRKNNKHYCIMIYPRVRTDGSNIRDWDSNIFANTSVDDPISISKEILENESYNNGTWTQ